MPIQVMSTGKWPTNRRLAEGDSEGFLDFLQEVRKLIVRYGAVDFLEPLFGIRDLRSVRDEIKVFMQTFAALPETFPRTEEQMCLQNLLLLEQSILSTRQAAYAACRPVMEFIVNHIDDGLRIMIDGISADLSIPVYKLVRLSMDLIASVCFGDADDVRELLMDNLTMGGAKTGGEVVHALNNISIVRQQMQLHYDFVVGTVNAVATAAAKAKNPDACPIMNTCPEIPDDDVFIQKLGAVLDRNSNQIRPFVRAFDDLEPRSWNNVVRTLRPLAVRIATDYGTPSSVLVLPSPVSALGKRSGEKKLPIGSSLSTTGSVPSEYQGNECASSSSGSSSTTCVSKVAKKMA